MDNIPTYYNGLIKELKEQFNHLQARWNQLYTQRRYAIHAKKTKRVEELTSQMMDISKKKTAIHEKLEQFAAKR